MPKKGTKTATRDEQTAKHTVRTALLLRISLAHQSGSLLAPQPRKIIRTRQCFTRDARPCAEGGLALETTLLFCQISRPGTLDSGNFKSYLTWVASRSKKYLSWPIACHTAMGVNGGTWKIDDIRSPEIIVKHVRGN